MLKILGIISILLVSTTASSHEYEVVVLDQVTGETASGKCANEIELNDLKAQIKNLNDKSVKLSVKKISQSMDAMAIKKGGGEGSGD